MREYRDNEDNNELIQIEGCSGRSLYYDRGGQSGRGELEGTTGNAIYRLATRFRSLPSSSISIASEAT